MRILVAFPGHTTSTIDVAIGYTHALKALGHTVSTFDYHTRLNFYKDALDYWSNTNPGYTQQKSDALVMASETLALEAVDFVPDVVLIVCGLALHRRAYDLLHRLNIPMALLLTESPYSDPMQAEIAIKGHIGLILTNDAASVSPLRVTGLPVEYVPHSFDPYRHYPRVVGKQYESDVYFFGTLWPEREALFAELRARQGGYKLDGITPIKDTPYGLISNAELARHYSGTKIALNHHRTVKGELNAQGEIEHITAQDAWSLGPRAFEIAACGAFQLSDNTRPELKEVFGASVATYTGAGDLADKAQYFLQHPDERKAMAEEAKRRVQGCSFEHRAREILLPALSKHL